MSKGAAAAPMTKVDMASEGAHDGFRHAGRKAQHFDTRTRPSRCACNP